MKDPSSIPRVRPEEIDTATMPALDVRTHTGKEQIRGALRYDPKVLVDEERLILPLPHNSRIVVYADDEQRAAQVATRLRQQGYTEAAILDGGFEAYRKSGLPIEEITQEQPIPGSEAGIPLI